MYCRKCGARIADGTSFCTSCGERVAPLAVTQDFRTQQSAQSVQSAQSAPNAAGVQVSQPVRNADEKKAPEAAEFAGTTNGTNINEPNVMNGTTEAAKMPETSETFAAAKAADLAEPAEAAKPIGVPPAPVYTAPVGQKAEATILPPVIAVPEKEKTKTDFGKGALAFCLVIIGLLAVSTGVFAGLYFSLL